MNKSHNFYVYVHSRFKDGMPFYVGKGFGSRAILRGQKSAHWQNIVAKDGGRYVNFVANNMDEELALLVEVETINKYRRAGVKLVNLTDGGEGLAGYKATAEVRAKMAAAHKGQLAWNKGIPHTEEARRKMSASRIGNTNRRGKKASEETRRKLSAARIGKNRSAETIAKMREAGLRRGISPELRAKMNAANQHAPASEETKRKMSATRKGRPALNRGMLHTEKTRARMSAAGLARWARVKAQEAA